MAPDQLHLDANLLQQPDSLHPDSPTLHGVITSIHVDMRNIIWPNVMHLRDEID